MGFMKERVSEIPANERDDETSTRPVIRPNLTDDELRTMAREKLSELLQAIDANKHPSLLLSVLRETMDRIEGRPTQRIEQKVEHSSKLASSELTNQQLLAMLQQASIAGLLPSGMKLAGDNLITDADYQTLDVV